MSDYSTWLPEPRMAGKPPFTIETPHAQSIEGETIPRRHPLAAHGFLTVPEEGCNTLYDILVRCAKKWPNERGFGRRKVVRKHVETKEVKKVVDGKEEVTSKDWTYFELGPYGWTTYGEYVELCMQLGSAYRKLGLEAGDRVHVYAATRYV